MTAYI